MSTYAPRIVADHLLNLRQEAHLAFDRLWQQRLMTRNVAYGKLCVLLNLTRDEAHFARLDAEQCRRAIEHFKQIEVAAFRIGPQEFGNRRQRPSRKRHRINKRRAREEQFLSDAEIDQLNLEGGTPCP